MSIQTIADTETSPPATLDRDAVEPVEVVGRPRRQWLRRLTRSWRTLVSLVLGVVIWQVLVWVFHPNPLAVVGPSQVLRDGRSLASSGVLWTDIAVSLKQFGLGFGIALVFGVLLGLVLGASPRISAYVDPWLTIFYTVPVIALAPVIIIWIGFGTEAKVVIVAVSAFFPIVINTRSGVQSVGGGLRDVCRAFRASKLETFRYVLFPGSLPYILAGVRLGVGRGLIGLIFGDLFGSTAGLGHLILTSQQNLQTGRVYVAVVVLGLLGLIFGAIVALLERRCATYLGTSEADR